jgi:hypothetical protein
MGRILLVLFFLSPVAGLAQDFDLNVVLMETTFLMVGQAKNPGAQTLGTAFVLLRPFAAQPDAHQTSGRLVLVTAAHVLEEMMGSSATIMLRTRQNGATPWLRTPARVAIRSNGQPLWKKLPNADVAVMYVKWPLVSARTVDTTFAPTTLLADDELLKKVNAIGPGVELKVLGYPLGNPGNEIGFSILRTGVIASYPLLPTLNTRTFLLDFRVFQGNSGGPVYFSQPIIRGSGFSCCPPQFIMGLVSQEALMSQPYSQLQLQLGQIVHASVIRATIDLLPAPETNEAAEGESPVELTPPQDGARP